MRGPIVTLRRLSRRLGWAAAIFPAVAACLLPQIACAQESFQRGANVGVMDRPRPGYEALGLRASGFIAYPSVTVRAERDDNLFARPDAVSDTIVTVSPSLEVRSDWGRHAAGLSLNADLRRHDRFKSEDTDTWSVAGTGRADIRHDTTLNAQASFAERVEPRTSAAYTVESVEPIEYSTGIVGLTASKTLSRVQVVGRAELSRYNYRNGRSAAGTVVDENYRDHDEFETGVKVAFAVSPTAAVFVDGGYQKMDYDPFQGRERDSDGVTALVGIDMEITRLITGEVSVGYIKQSFNDPAYKDIAHPHYRVRLAWYPTQLITVGITATQRVTDSPLPSSPAYLSRAVELKADYELLRNLILSGQIRGADQDYRGIDRHDRRYGGTLSANYLLNRAVGVSLRYRYETLSSSGASRGRDFDDNSFSLALVFQR